MTSVWAQMSISFFDRKFVTTGFNTHSSFSKRKLRPKVCSYRFFASFVFLCFCSAVCTAVAAACTEKFTISLRESRR